MLQTEWPTPNEEYPGWINTLTAANEAGETFTIAELGAGWGRWLVNGAVAARKLGKSFRLIGVEAEPKHFRWLRVHLRDNGIPEGCATLHLAALAPKAGAVYFHVGEPRAWYGQTIAGPAEAGSPSDLRRELLRLGRRHNPSRDITRVPAVTLDDVIGDVDHVDLLDVDIQGAEAEVMSQARADLDRVVKRVHVRTHSKQIERSLRETFIGLGWRNVHDFACLSTNKTPWGRIKFQDGVQTWVNPRL